MGTSEELADRLRFAEMRKVDLVEVTLGLERALDSERAAHEATRADLAIALGTVDRLRAERERERERERADRAERERDEARQRERQALEMRDAERADGQATYREAIKWRDKFAAAESRTRALAAQVEGLTQAGEALYAVCTGARTDAERWERARDVAVAEWDAVALPLVGAEPTFPVCLSRSEGAYTGPRLIPMWLARRAYKAYAEKYYGGRQPTQTLERIGERGGWYPSELDDLAPGWRDDLARRPVARAALASAPPPAEGAETDEPQWVETTGPRMSERYGLPCFPETPAPAPETAYNDAGEPVAARTVASVVPAPAPAPCAACAVREVAEPLCVAAEDATGSGRLRDYVEAQLREAIGNMRAALAQPAAGPGTVADADPGEADGDHASALESVYGPEDDGAEHLD